MITFRDVQEFCEEASRVRSQAMLQDTLQDISQRMGFRYFALTHHIDLRAAPSSGVRIANYPQRWIEFFDEQRLFAVDPIHRASHSTSLGFAWSDVSALINLTPRDHTVLSKAREAGIGDGFTIPANVPGEANGSCSFAMEDGATIYVEQFPLVQLVGNFAFESARRLMRPQARSISPTPRLTERQLECVALVARGKTDWEISRILGVSHETVIQHLKDARERYGVSNRTMLTVRALFDGSITFTDILAK
ncbi:MAG: LuxR family transcriptional regulator [Methylocystaceae bacterium]|nr:MAG: LuxR family transcriptional regulator [Methylocystaceae bacterium]